MKHNDNRLEAQPNNSTPLEAVHDLPSANEHATTGYEQTTPTGTNTVENSTNESVAPVNDLEVTESLPVENSVTALPVDHSQEGVIRVSPTTDGSNTEMTLADQTVPEDVEVVPYIGTNRKSRANQNLGVEPAHPATVAPSNGGTWVVSQPHLDSPRSPFYGVTLTEGMKALGLEEFNGGDIVTIEVGVGNKRTQISGRSSRPRAIYIRKEAWDRAHCVLHQPFHYVIVRIQAGQ